MDPGLKLRHDFAIRQRQMMRGARIGQARRGLAGLLVGAFCGALALGATAVIMRVGAQWHTFLLEVCLCAAFGYYITRSGGGILKGAFGFPAAYGAAFLLRPAGIDPAVLFDPAGQPLTLDPLSQLVAVGSLLLCGGLFGYIAESRGT